ncbi:MAG: hypothetical protein HY863_01375 [Chloroflexi bacterium]|nr:hypothetical protein [Chloroflexota bacterium]
MSKRKRHSAGQTNSHQIEWLKHRTGYPSPEEREAIIRLRQEVSAELIKMMVMKVDPERPRAQALYKKYGQEEVERAIKMIDSVMNLPPLIANEARSYREYRQRYARFGAGLKFYSSKEMKDLLHVYAEQYINGENAEVTDFLLTGWREWDDITPPAIPLRPAEFANTQIASYPAPINELLEWGDDLKRSHDFEDESKYLQWKKLIPALTRMALDPNLLNGWPSERSSWASWHAIHALGNLKAWDSAPALAQLANLENDWLSDHLPHIWADMGLEVEPSLWMILEDSSASAKQRGLAAEALYNLTEDNEAMENKIITGFEKILNNRKVFDTTVNAISLRSCARWMQLKTPWKP